MYSSTTEITKNINELQSDILGESLSKNPLMKKSSLPTKNKKLNTNQQVIVPAINEILKAQENLTKLTEDALNNMYRTLGNLSADSMLANKITSRGASVIDLLADITDLVTKVYEDKFYVAENENRTEFKLTHVPAGKIKLFIDGIRYFNGNDKENFFTYNKDTNTVTWINTDENTEGFQLSDMDVVFEYSYLAEEAG